MNKCEFIPVVILNNGFGIGMEFGDAIVTDAHWLETILREGSLSGGAKRDLSEKSFTTKTITIYNSESDFVKNARRILIKPPMLADFERSTIWDSFQMPTSDGQELTVSRARLDNDLLVKSLGSF